MSVKKAVVLLSGGLDSATVLAMALNDGFECYALSFRYGQRHKREIAAAVNVAESLGAVKHFIIAIDLSIFGGSALTDMDIEVPKNRVDLGRSEIIPLTYVPARNTIFLAYALAWAEVNHIFDIFIGVNTTDYSGYPDCRAEFIRAFEVMANLATAAAVEVARFGLAKLGLCRIEIVAAVGNTASRRVAEKTGAMFEGILRNRIKMGDRNLDAAMYSLIPGDLEDS